MADIDKIKRNIGRMIDAGAPETDIDSYLSSEGVSVDQLKQTATTPAAPAGGGFIDGAKDFVKSIPGGIASGMSGFASLAQTITGADQDTTDDPLGDMAGKAFNSVAEALPKPEGTAGQYGRTVGEFAGNPISYVGPGTLALKAGGVALGGLGSEAGGQAFKDTGYETAGRIAGGMAGGFAAAKTLGPTKLKAATPTLEELENAATSGYAAARKSGLELDPRGFGQWAAVARQELTNGSRYAFTGGPQGTAPKTFAAIDSLQNAPAGARITAANIDTLRRHLGDIAGEVQPAAGGFAKPTSDAKAAMVLQHRLASYMESVPQGHVMAGDPAQYVRAIKQANGDWAAAQRLRNVDARLTKAESATDRQIAGSLDSQIKSKVGSMLDNPERMRGLNQAEKDQIKLINSGSITSNIMRQAGRGGAGVIPAISHVALGAPAAAATGGMSLIPQAALAASLYGARKGAEAMTVSRAKKLAEMLAKRSPEYESRVRGLPQVSLAPNQAAIIRSLFGSIAPR